MPKETAQAQIIPSVVETSEPTAKVSPLSPAQIAALQAGQSVQLPGEEPTVGIFATLKPLGTEQPTYFAPDWTDFYSNYVLPPPIDYTELPRFEAPQGELIINIETTAVKPWESRIICIGVLDPNAGEPTAINFIRETEQATINEFIEWFEASGYTTLIGYNVSFDYRFIYAVCQKYRLTVRNFMAAELEDLMQIQKQVKEEFVFGFNPNGTLEQWSTYLFGTVPYAKQEMVWKWFESGNVDEIINFNSDKLVKTYFLWVLNKVVSGTIPGAEIIARPSTPTESLPQDKALGNPNQSEEVLQVQCPHCLQDNTMPKTARVINCSVCGEPIAHP